MSTKFKKTDLRADQLKVINQLCRRHRTFLIARMGSGKTVCFLSAFERMNRKYGYKTLIIAPVRVVDMVWRQEKDNWEHLQHLSIDVLKTSNRKKIEYSDADILLTSFGMLNFLKSNKKIYQKYDILCIDESSYLKHWMTQRMKALRHIINTHTFENIILMTGTPSSSGKYFELFSQTYVLDRGERFGKSKTRFENKYYNFDRHNLFITHPRPGTVREIRDKIKDLVIVPPAKKIKEPVFNEVIVKLPGNIMEQYKSMERYFMLELKESNFELYSPNAATKWSHCRQIASGFLYDGEGDDRKTLVLHNKKYEALQEIIETTSGGVLIFFGYIHERETLTNKLNIPELSDINLAKWNEKQLKSMCCSYRSATHGLNLQHGGNTIVWFTQGPPEMFLQGNSRIWGRNGKEDVIIHSILTEGTIDIEYNASLHVRKNSERSFISSLKERTQWNQKD